jgi:hypothetical protein
MTEIVDQEVLESRKFTKEVVIPGYRDIFIRAWNKLFWEPAITFDPDNPLAETLVEAVSTHHEWKGFAATTVDAKGEMRTRWFADTKYPDQYKLHNPGLGSKILPYEYVQKAPQAESSLKHLKGKQEEELRTNPEGRSVIWKPEQALLGVTRTKVIGHPDAPITVFVRQGRFHCPTHTDEELVADLHYSIEGLTCPTNPDHFWVFTK